MNDGAFYVLSALAVLSAIGVVAYGRNPVYSAVSLVFNFFVLAMLYFTMGAQFLGITQMMVYAGAIMVLFLFVILILKQAKARETEKRPAIAAWGLSIAAAALGLFVIAKSANIAFPDGAEITAPETFGTPQSIGGALFFTEYVWPFIIAGVLLTLGVVASILLAKRRI